MGIEHVEFAVLVAVGDLMVAEVLERLDRAGGDLGAPGDHEPAGRLPGERHLHGPRLPVADVTVNWAATSIRRNLSGVHEVATDVSQLPSTIEVCGYPAEVTGEHADASKRIQELTEVLEVIRPVIAADGGSLDLLGVDIATGVVRLQLSGACGSCAVSASTLNDGVDRIIRTRLDWVTKVVGVVEESDIGGLGGWTPKHS